MEVMRRGDGEGRNWGGGRERPNSSGGEELLTDGLCLWGTRGGLWGGTKPRKKTF